MLLRLAFIYTFLSCLLFGIACGEASDSNRENETTEKVPEAEVDYKSLARIICDCAQPSIELNKQMAKLQEQGKREEFIAKAEQVAETYRDVTNCVLKERATLTSAALNQDDTYSAVLNSCPSIPERLAQSLSKLKE